MVTTAARGVPVTVLMGSLGAGETTLLNRILTHKHGKKVAVIVNEFGEVGIDNKRVIDADEEIFEMNNGRICCIVRGNLIRIIGNLMQCRDKFDHLVIGTTGLADPAPVILTFCVDKDIQSQLALDAVITVVDANHIWQHWDRDEAQEQIAFADVILLNKIDLLTEDELTDLERHILDRNAMVKIYRTHNSNLEIESILGVKASDVDRALPVDPEFLNEDVHEHDEFVDAFAMVEGQLLDVDRLSVWVNELLQTRGPDIFRMQGILNLDGEAERFVFQGVHIIFDGRSDRPWKPEETRCRELVCIGRNLNETELRKGFRTCLA